MSKYTTEVRFICEEAAGLIHSKGVDDVESIIQAAIPKIFNFDFPIFDESYRNVLETKILKHYYTREIGEETVGLWKLRMNTTLNEIMPYYNKLYESELLEFNPLYDVNYTREGSRNTNETGSEEGEVNRDGTGRDTGTITDSGTTSNVQTMTGTVQDAGTGENTKTMTGTVTDVGNEESETGSTTARNTENSGTDTETTNSAQKNNRWEYFSDTPQGTIGSVPGGGQQALEGQTYLTNVRHITDDGTGSTSTKTFQHGHEIDENTTTTGTVQTDTSNTKTYNTTESDESENTNTKTYDTETEDSGTSGNTRTLNTTNTTAETTTDTRSKELTNLQEYAETVSGKMGGSSYAKMLMEFRETFLNIDMMILEDLQPLFFGLWE